MSGVKRVFVEKKKLLIDVDGSKVEPGMKALNPT